MLTREENERFTRVGPGTPAGEMLRRYWWPVALSPALGAKPVPVRLLAEDFILFRSGSGQLGMLDRLCAHRGTSLEFGRVEDRGIRCCYHGWLYDTAGRCIDQPIEPEGSAFADKVRLRAYPMQEAGGFVFAYIGPEPAPVLPNIDLFDRRDGTHALEVSIDYCNWLQRAENGVDQGHLGVLHASMYPHLALKRPSYEWQPTDYGVRNVLYIEGQPPRVTHFIFPSHSRISTTPRSGYIPSHDLRFRVPTDDTTTTTFADRFQPSKDGRYDVKLRVREAPIPGVYERAEDGWWDIPSNIQDRVAQEAQGPIADRTIEHLGASDRGITMFRKLLADSIDAVAADRDPFGVMRDSARAEWTFDSTLPEVAYAS